MKNVWFRIIAVFEMVGGAIGILFMLYAASVAGFAATVILPAFIAIIIFALSLAAGIWLWKAKERGRKASIVVQFIQLPKFVSPALTVMFSFGFDVFAHMTFVNNFSTVGVQFRLLADGQLFLGSQDAPFVLGISIPAIIALAKLWNYDPTLEAENALNDGDLPPGPDKYFDPSDNQVISE